MGNVSRRIHQDKSREAFEKSLAEHRGSWHGRHYG